MLLCWTKWLQNSKSLWLVNYDKFCYHQLQSRNNRYIITGFASGNIEQCNHFIFNWLVVFNRKWCWKSNWQCANRNCNYPPIHILRLQEPEIKMDSEDSELSYGFSLDHNCARCGSYFKKKCKDDKLKFSCGHAYHYECVKENDHCYANGCEMLYMPWDETFPLELQAFVFNKERKDLNANIR